MRNEEIIQKLYKLLVVYEKYDFSAYKSYCLSLIQMLEGLENKYLEETLLRLKGLYKYSKEQTEHDSVKDIVLDGCNRLQRHI